MCAVTPLIIGALAAGLFAMFSLQTSTSNRLSDSGDAQVVSANFEPDVQQAQQVAVGNLAQNECSSQQVFGVEWGQITGGYENVVSYVVSANGLQFNLVRDLCQPGPSGLKLVSSTILSYNVGPTPTFTINCTSAGEATCSTDQSAGSWVPTTDVESAQLSISEPSSTEKGGSYQYSLSAVPAATATVSSGGQPVTITASTGCGYAAPGSGPLSSSLCLIDFSNLLGTPSLLTDAETPGSCLEESVPLSGGFTLYFCINISNTESGEVIEPFALPTWCDGFLGNPGTSAACGATGVYPNYYDVPGDPALYQQGTGGGVNDGYDTTITLSKIQIINGSGTPATGWAIFSADAESTDSGCGSGCNGESVTWSSNTNVTVISNGYTAANGYCTGGNVPCDTATDPWGNACDGGGSWQSNGTTYYGIAGNSSDTEDYFGSGGTPIQTNTVECTVPSNHQNVTLTGAGMVEAIMPNTFSAALGDGPGGLEAVAFGLLTS
ncbi:MAG: hypothetical protein WCA31_01780 [Acidimicrobiales bacterium]